MRVRGQDLDRARVPGPLMEWGGGGRTGAVPDAPASWGRPSEPAQRWQGAQPTGLSRVLGASGPYNGLGGPLVGREAAPLLTQGMTSCRWTQRSCCVAADLTGWVSSTSGLAPQTKTSPCASIKQTSYVCMYVYICLRYDTIVAKSSQARDCKLRHHRGSSDGWARRGSSDAAASCHHLSPADVARSTAISSQKHNHT